jgi:hypothetical protein
MRGGNGETEDRGENDGEPGTDGNGKQKLRRACNDIRHQTLAGKGTHQRFSKKHRGDRASEGGNSGNGERRFIRRDIATVKRGDAFEIIVRPVGVGDEEDGKEERDCDEHAVGALSIEIDGIGSLVGNLFNNLRGHGAIGCSLE